MTNPIEAAVLPLRTDAMARAVEFAQNRIAKTLAALEAANWDLDVAFPRGNSMKDRREIYKAKMAAHNFASSITTYVKSSRSFQEPNLRKTCQENEIRFMADAAEQAGLQYDTFVAKLTRKVGDCLAADLTGSHVWGYSFLTVIKEGGIKEVWKTQQIVNQSHLGTVFNQWPTRKLKGKGA